MSYIGWIVRFLIAASFWQALFRLDDRPGGALLIVAAGLVYWLEPQHAERWILLFVASGAWLVFLDLRGTRSRRRREFLDHAAARGPGRPLAFGYKISWVAVRADSPAAVLEALELRETATADWGHGLERAYEAGILLGPGRIFVTPALNGWVLLVGRGLPQLENPGKPQLPVPFVQALSGALETDVQYFVNHRTVSAAGWMRARAGRLERAYATADGELLLDEGQPDSAEQEVLAASAAALKAVDPDEEHQPDESDVMALAGRWSLDPSTLDAWTEAVGPGTLGRLPADWA